MSHLTTELLTSLLQSGAATNEFLRNKIEEGVNAVLKAELAGFLGYKKHSSAGWHTGNSHNGSYQRTIVTAYGKITVDVPRDRNGEFQSPLLPARKNMSIRRKPPSSNCTNAVSRRVKSQSLSNRCMAIATRWQPSPRLQRMSRIRLSSFTLDRLPSDMPSSFVTRCTSISAATAWPRRLSTSCSALRRMGTRKFSTMPFCRLSRH